MISVAVLIRTFSSGILARRGEEHKPDPWSNPIERNHMGLHADNEVATRVASHHHRSHGRSIAAVNASLKILWRVGGKGAVLHPFAIWNQHCPRSVKVKVKTPTIVSNNPVYSRVLWVPDSFAWSSNKKNECLVLPSLPPMPFWLAHRLLYIYIYIYIYLGLWRVNLRTGYGQLWDALYISINRLNIKCASRRSNDVSTHAWRTAAQTATWNSTNLTPCHVMLSTYGCPNIYMLHIYVVTVGWVGVIRCNMEVLYISTNARWGSLTA